jgi:hypothetical protein
MRASWFALRASLAFNTVFDKTGLLNSHYPAARAAIDVVRETKHDGGENDRERFSGRMIESILT